MTKKIFISMLALLAIATTAGAQEDSVNGHEYVDLGLPSGLLWATCNVGATKPEAYGDYFAWGETTTKKDYSWATYERCKGSEETLTKYCNNSEYGNNGFTDNLTTLEAEDDAAAVNWKSGWRMPTKADFQELLTNTTNEEVTVNGVKGFKFTSKTNDNSIFLPVAEWGDGTSIGVGNSRGYYWASSLNESLPSSAGLLWLISADEPRNIQSEVSLISQDRYRGHSVRPVIKKSELGIEINATNFPDANFRSYVAANTIDKDGNGWLSDEEIAAVKTMNVSSKSIKDLTGIEHFTALTGLNCSKNQLTKLNVSKNTKLTVLTCFNNQISGLNMTELVNSLPKVQKDPRTGEGGRLIVINSAALNGKDNFIATAQAQVAAKKNWKMYDYRGGIGDPAVYAGSDDLTPLGIAIIAPNFPDEKFRAFVSSNYDTDKNGYLSPAEIAAVTQMDCTNKSTTDDNGITNLKGIEHFTALVGLGCNKNNLGETGLDLSKNTKLQVLGCTGCKLKELNLSKNTALRLLSCQGNALEKLDVSKNTALTYLACYANQIKGDAMQTLVNNLPTPTSGKFIVVDKYYTSHDWDNVITKSQVAIAKGKNWTVYDNNTGTSDSDWVEYEGIDDTPTSIDASLNDNGQLTNDSWYSIDGKRLSGEPTQKGVYIVNGKKVVK